MKNKIKIDLMSPSVSLNDLAQPQYNGILSYEVPNKWIYNNTLPASLKVYNDTNIYSMIFTVENIIDTNTNTCVQKIYNVEDQNVFTRLGYPSGYNIDTNYNSNTDYTFTEWKSDAFDENIMKNYYSKFELNNLFLQSSTPNKVIFDSIFKYKGTKSTGSYANITETGYYVITGALTDSPALIATHNIDGILEVYATVDKVYQVLTVSKNYSKPTDPIVDANFNNIASLVYNGYSETFNHDPNYNHNSTMHFRCINRSTGVGVWSNVETIHKIYMYQFLYNSLEKFAQVNNVASIYFPVTAIDAGTTVSYYQTYNKPLDSNQHMPYTAGFYANPNFVNGATNFVNSNSEAMSLRRRGFFMKRDNLNLTIERWG